MRQSPGIYVIDQPPPLEDGLPVMDVPVFVGFAERGPVDRPVALEDISQYRGVFGGDLDLVARPDGSMLQAHLPAAVASFFGGGGRRCYVIRIAGPQAARVRFTVPGLRLAYRDSGAAWQLADRDFELRSASPGAWADRYQLGCRVRSELVHRQDGVRAGDLLRVRHDTLAPGTAGWLSIAGFAADVPATVGAAIERANSRPGHWLWLELTATAVSPPLAAASASPSPIVDADQWLVEKITVDLALRHPSLPELHREACSLTSGTPDVPVDSPWIEPDADGLYDRGSPLPGAEWPLCGAGADAGLDGLPSGWLLLPVGVDAEFGLWQPAAIPAGDAIERNGLAEFTADLFVDPAWSREANLRGQALLDWADNIRYFGDAPRRMRGLHGVLGRDDLVAREATWIAAPDAVHPQWSYQHPPAATTPGSLAAQPDGPCPEQSETAFERCVKPPRRPSPPAFFQIPTRMPASVDWFIDTLDSGSPAGFEIALEAQWARQPDFSDALPVPVEHGNSHETAPATVPPTTRYVLNLPAGRYFLRARVWRRASGEPWSAALISDWSTPQSVLVLDGGWHAAPGPADGATVATVHGALRDLCSATREHFALLSVPEDWDATLLAHHVDNLRSLGGRVGGAEALDAAARHAASFVSVYHPWLVQRGEAGATHRHPADGAVLGVYAKRSRLKGAWAAAGLDPLDAVDRVGAHAPDAIEAAGANAIESRTSGIATTRAFTVSEETEWQGIGVRRLFILLRRLARREGERYLFEPNDLSLRRSLERGFDAVLARLMRRGAFSGTRASEAYWLRTRSGIPLREEIDRGECSLEIGVAPSRPLRFLTLRMVRSGENLLIEDRS